VTFAEKEKKKAQAVAVSELEICLLNFNKK